MTTQPIDTCEICGDGYHGIKFVRHDPDKMIALCFMCTNLYSDDYAKTHGGERPEFKQYQLQRDGTWRLIDSSTIEPEDL